MNKFELFSMIFYVLDAEWDESKILLSENFSVLQIHSYLTV